MALTPLLNMEPFHQEVEVGENEENTMPSFTITILAGREEAGKTPLLDTSNTVRRQGEQDSQRADTEDGVSSLARRQYYRDEQLLLECEWEHCTAQLSDTAEFEQHVAGHVQEAAVRPGGEEMQDMFACLWAECGFETGSSEEMVRHIHFHGFHTKIKCHGSNMLARHQLAPCTLDPAQRNIVPDLSEPPVCGWAGCSQAGAVWSQPHRFYRHVQEHGEERRGKEVRCQWAGCTKTDGSVSKLKEHLRSHSQERLIGCPQCGALFANRVKFLDHCKRQRVSSLSNLGFTCNNCGKKFALERLLRDHMRSHINHYKCPQCDMTCPTPSALANHIRYKHLVEKPFKCELCEYAGKTQHDVKAHLKVHYEEVELACTEPGCPFRCRAQQTMKKHFLKTHRNTESVYACHLCDKRYNRGAYLTKHLIKLHQFSWPSGHSRFRYNRDETTGEFRLQTIRFESLDLQEELQAGSSLRIAESEVEPGGEVEGDGRQFRTSSPVQPSSDYSGSPAWSGTTSTPHSTHYQQSPLPQASDSVLSFLSRHEQDYTVKYPLDPMQ